MKEVKTKQTEMINHEIQLLKGVFTAEQASEIIMSLINQKISFHQVKGIQDWENNHDADQQPLKNRIKELEHEKIMAERFISEMKAKGNNLNIDGKILLKMIE